MYRPRIGASFWTSLAAIAGVIGAAAAVYPLLKADQSYMHLAPSGYGVRVLVFSEPVILTGNSYVKKRWLQRGTDSSISIETHFLRNRLVTADQGAFIAVGQTAGVIDCAVEAGDFEFGLEFTSKHGTSWASTRLPFCASGATIGERARGAFRTVRNFIWSPDAPRFTADGRCEDWSHAMQHDYFGECERREKRGSPPTALAPTVSEPPNLSSEEQNKFWRFRKELDALDLPRARQDGLSNHSSK